MEATDLSLQQQEHVLRQVFGFVRIMDNLQTACVDRLAVLFKEESETVRRTLLGGGDCFGFGHWMPPMIVAGWVGEGMGRRGMTFVMTRFVRFRASSRDGMTMVMKSSSASSRQRDMETPVSCEYSRTHFNCAASILMAERACEVKAVSFYNQVCVPWSSF